LSINVAGPQASYTRLQPTRTVMSLARQILQHQGILAQTAAIAFESR
jgi:hypothetical protein